MKIRKKTFCIFIFMFLPFVGLVGAIKENQNQDLSIETMSISLYWKYTEESVGSVFSTPTIGQMDNRFDKEILFADDNGIVYTLTNEGNLDGKSDDYEEQHFDAFRSSPAFAEFAQDRRELEFEILIGSLDNNMYCLNYTGHVLWEKDSLGPIWASPCIVDYNQDGIMEVIFGSASGRLFCLERDGSTHFQKDVGHSILSTPVVADINDDGVLDVIVVTSDGNVHCYNYDGYDVTKLWTYTTSGTVDNINSSVAIAELIENDNGEKKQLEIVAALNGDLHCINSLGTSEWVIISPDVDDITPAIGNIDFSDNELEIVFCANDGDVFCVEEDGTTYQWSSPAILGGTLTYPALADLDNDDRMEVIIGCIDGNVYCLNYYDGSIKCSYNLQVSINSSVVVGDSNENGKVEIYVGAADGIYCLRLNDVVASGSEQWYTESGSIFRTGRMDSDSDYLDDLNEEFYDTDWKNPDSDLDGYSDGIEILKGTDPNDEDSTPKIGISTLITAISLINILGIILVLRIRTIRRKTK